MVRHGTCLFFGRYFVINVSINRRNNFKPFLSLKMVINYLNCETMLTKVLAIQWESGPHKKVTHSKTHPIVRSNQRKIHFQRCNDIVRATFTI